MLSKPFSSAADPSLFPHPQLRQGDQGLKVIKRAHALRHALISKLGPGNTGHMLKMS